MLVYSVVRKISELESIIPKAIDLNKKSDFSTTTAAVEIKIKESKVPGVFNLPKKKDLSSEILNVEATISDTTFSKISDFSKFILIHLLLREKQNTEC